MTDKSRPVMKPVNKFTKQIPAGMFEITKPMKYLSDLDRWIEHFKLKGIKTAVIQNRNGEFILCREGIEYKGDHYNGKVRS
jgi:hypothetical protein